MSDSHNGTPIGDQMKNAVTEALQSGDFRNLNNLVVQTMADTLSEVGVQIAQGTTSVWEAGKDGRQEQEQRRQEQMQRQERRRQEQMQRQEQHRQEQIKHQQEQQIRRQEEQRRQEQIRLQQEQFKREQIKQQQERFRQEQIRQQNAISQQKHADPSLVKVNRVGGKAGFFCQLFGLLGFFIMIVLGLGVLFEGIGAANDQLGIAVAAISDMSFAAFFGGIFLLGNSLEGRLKRAERYIRLCDYRMYGNIKDLAAATGKSERYVRNDIQKMLAVHMFPEGHLDKQGTCFMLNDVVYGQYLELEKNRISAGNGSEEIGKQDAGAQDAGQEGSVRNTEMLSGQETELNTMVAEGMECIRRLRDLNDKIPGEAISDRLYRLENLLKEIFDSVRIHPEQMNRMHKLMDYYLPTTLKLVETYEEFNRVSTPGQEILDAKLEIENTLDTINQAFKELLNNLFQSAVFDVTTDAQVLKSMLAREGLTRELEFVRRP